MFIVFHTQTYEEDITCRVLDEMLDSWDRSTFHQIAGRSLFGHCVVAIQDTRALIMTQEFGDGYLIGYLRDINTEQDVQKCMNLIAAAAALTMKIVNTRTDVMNVRVSLKEEE